MRRYALTVVLAVTAGCAQTGALRRDEQVVFFPTVGYPVDGGAEWVLPIHGWVYESSWFSRNIDVAEDMLDIESFLDCAADRATLRERVRPFLVENKEGRRVPILLGDRVVELSPALATGHIHDEIRLSASSLSLMQTVAQAGPARVDYHSWHRGQDAIHAGHIYLLETQGLTVVSDIDDTIRVTEVRDTKRMLDNTFVQEFRAVSGMAALYTDWANRHHARFHYLSASPAQLARPLESFLADSGFPEGSVSLRTVEMRSNFFKTVLDLFDAPPEYKLVELAWLMQALPERRYVLVGDSGQNDPEVYGEIARRFRPQVSMILIRELDCCQERDAPRYREAFRDLPDSSWILFRDPSAIRAAPGDRAHDGGRERQRPESPWRDVSVQQVAAYK